MPISLARLTEPSMGSRPNSIELWTMASFGAPAPFQSSLMNLSSTPTMSPYDGPARKLSGYFLVSANSDANDPEVIIFLKRSLFSGEVP